MLYTEYMRKAYTITLDYCENGLCYLRPDFRRILSDAGMDETVISDWTVPMDAIEDELKLEAERRNLASDKTRQVMDWLYELLTTSITPKITQEESDLVNNIVEYMNTKDKLNEKENRLKAREHAVQQKEDVRRIVSGINFSKR